MINANHSFSHPKFSDISFEKCIKATSKADLIIFPELSVTNYEPALAKVLATDPENSIFDRFQQLSDSNQITIGIGMSTTASDGVLISMILFQPNKKRSTYSKLLLHSDELPYFVCGKNQLTLTIKGTRIGIGICYETLQREHILNTYKQGIDIYIASVAKSKGGVEKAYNFFPKIAKEFNTPILMANCVGYCDNFMSIGQSAVWSENGELIDQLDSTHQGILTYDTDTKLVTNDQPSIEVGQLPDLEEVFQIYLNAKLELERNGIYQWVKSYPTKTIIENDLKNKVLFVLKSSTNIIGAINISTDQESEYQKVEWKFDDTQVLVIHRLVINPDHQRNGYAQRLMDFAENYAAANKYTSIRLDAYSQNARVLEFYQKRNYDIRGEVSFPKRAFPFYCMEKEIDPSTTL